MVTFILLMAEPRQRNRIKHIYDTYHEDMLRVAAERLRKSGSMNFETDAEDVVQSAFMKIGRYIHRVPAEGNPSDIKVYVLAILSNEISNFLKESASFDAMNGAVEMLEDGHFFEQMRIQERYAEVVEAIEGLDERYSVVLLLRYREELSVKDVSRLLSIPEKTVYTRLARGKKKLLEVLGYES